MTKNYEKYDKTNPAHLNCEKHVHPGEPCCPGCVDDWNDDLDYSGISEHPDNEWIEVGLCCTGYKLLTKKTGLDNYELWEKALELYEQEKKEEGLDS